MPITQLNPYLFFDGTAVQAIKHYESALGANAKNLQKMGDVPGAQIPADHRDRVMHCELAIGPGTVMISDGMPGDPPRPGSNMDVVLNFDDPADMGRRFEALGAGGKITSPLQDTFWGARFGTLTDAYGIRWMFNCPLKKA
jgi:PhnB protein